MTLYSINIYIEFPFRVVMISLEHAYLIISIFYFIFIKVDDLF